MQSPQEMRAFVDRLFTTSERTNFETVWEELSEYITPNQTGSFRKGATNAIDSTGGTNTTLGAKKTRNLYDSTAIKANQDLSSAIFSAIYNPNTKFVNLRFKEEHLNDKKSTAMWLETVNDILHSHFVDSNLITELPRALRQYPALGSTALMHEIDLEGQFNFSALHLNNLAWLENRMGRVDTVARKMIMTVQQIVEKWPKTIPYNVQRLHEKGRLEEQLTVIQSIKKNENFKDTGAELLAPKDRPFIYHYMLEDQKDGFLEMGGYYDFPVYALRWDMYPGESYGRGIGHLAIPDVRSLNVTRRLVLTALAKAVNPSILATKRAAMGGLDFRAGGLSVVNRLDDIREFNTNARFEVASLETEELRKSIKEAFFLDKLILPPRTETGEMTAFEVSVRTEQIQRVLGSTFGRLNKELLEPMILRSFKSLLRLGKLPDAPPEIIEQGIDVDLVYSNQLARSQNMEELNTIQAWLQGVAALAELDPGVINIPNLEEIIRNDAKERGVPELAVRSREDVEEIEEAQQQQAQQQQMLESGVQAADIASKLGAGGGQGAQ